jgi:hypothetical protein
VGGTPLPPYFREQIFSNVRFAGEIACKILKTGILQLKYTKERAYGGGDFKPVALSF